jgi:predicted cupin superfamily sugar epimerase
MADELAAEDVRNLLDLEPNATCGFVRITYVSPQSIAAGGLPSPFGDRRPVGSALYFMVTPTAPVRLHRIRNDQLYHYYLGDSLEVFLLRNDGSSERVIVGPDLRGGGAHPTLHPREHLPYCEGDRPTPLVPRRKHGMAGGWFPPTSRLARSMTWRRSIRGFPLTCAPSRRPSGRMEDRFRAAMANLFSPLARRSRRGSARAA